MDRRDTVRQLWEVLPPHLAEQGYELIEVEVTGGGRPVVRLYLDKPGGFTLDDCTQATRLLSPLLDTLDFLSERYLLEVSSPGIDRPLRRPEDFSRFHGESVRITTETPSAGRSRFRGTLTGFADGLVGVECEGETYRIHIENVKKANLDR